MKKVLAVALMMGCGSAYACDITPNAVTVEATITDSQAAQADTAWEAIAVDLRAFGSMHYEHEGRVRVRTTIAASVFGFQVDTITNDYMMDKLCNQTLEDAANNAAANARQMLNPPDNGGSTGNNGSSGTPVYSPIIIRPPGSWVFRCTMGGRPILCSEYSGPN